MSQTLSQTSSLPHGQDRTQLVVSDPDRSLATAWGIDGGFDTSQYAWIGPGGSRTPVSRIHLPRTSGNGWPLGFYGSARILGDARPGAWTLDCGRGAEFAFEVVAPQFSIKKPTTLSPGATADDLTKAIAKGDVILAPGMYDFGTDHVTPTAWRRLTGPGAVIRSAAPDWQFDTADFFTVDGVAFEGPPVAQRCIGVFQWHPDLVCRRCTFRDCNYGGKLAYHTLIDCTFDTAGMTEAPFGLNLRSRFTGPGSPHAYQLLGVSGAAALIDPLFDGTDRGIVWNTNQNPVNDNLVVGAVVRGCVTTENGCEGLLGEGAKECSRHLILSCRYDGLGPAVAFNTLGGGHLLWNHQGNGPFLFWGTQAGTVVADSEVRSYVEFSPGAAGHAVRDTGVWLPYPPRGSIVDGVVWPYDEPARQYAVRVNPKAPGAAVPGQAPNTLTGLRVYPGPGMRGIGPGLAVDGCSISGVGVADVAGITVPAP